MSRIRRPEEVLLQISQGDWLLVKKRLNAGEARRVFARMVKTIKRTDEATPNAAVEYDVYQMGLSKSLEYLLDWSITDDDGKQVVIRDRSTGEIQAALESLDLDSFNEITKAIETHEEAMDAEETARKNDQATASRLSVTSRLPEPVTGATNG